MASATQSAATPAAPGGGLKEWFWRGNALAAAKAAPKASSLRRERLRRARLAAELADRTINPAEPLRDGSALPLAISLYREAAYWALIAHDDSSEKATMTELLAAGRYHKPSLSDADFELVRSTLADKSFVETAEDRADVLCREADLCQAFVHGLIHSELDADDRVTSVLVQRWVRVGVVVLILLGILYALNAAVQSAMRGRTWRSGGRGSRAARLTTAIRRIWNAVALAARCSSTPPRKTNRGSRSTSARRRNSRASKW